LLNPIALCNYTIKFDIFKSKSAFIYFFRQNFTAMSQALFARDFACRFVRFLSSSSGKSGQPFIINEVDLDAAAFGWAAAATSRSKAEHALKLERSERPSERQRRPCPSKADWCTGNTGARSARGTLTKIEIILTVSAGDRF